MRKLSPAQLVIGLFLVGGLSATVHAVDGDITFQREAQEGDTPPAIFPHWAHRIRFKCYACHPGLFQMKAGANPIKMEEIRTGKWCGTCHNGTTAWPVTFETCSRCHVPR